MKTDANEVFAIFQRFQDGKISYDRALEDASRLMDKIADNRPIVGYVKSGLVRQVFNRVLGGKNGIAVNGHHLCRVDENTLGDIERMLKD